MSPPILPGDIAEVDAFMDHVRRFHDTLEEYHGDITAIPRKTLVPLVLEARTVSVAAQSALEACAASRSDS